MYELCGEENSEQLVHSQVEKALRIFTYCWAIAKDGTTSHSEDSDRKFYLDRNFEQNPHDQTGDSLVMGLYPHRLTDFADVGKIFAAVCKAIILIDQSNQQNNVDDNASGNYTNPLTWDEVESLINSLHDRCEPSSLKSREVLEQERYNGHFEGHFNKAKVYFEQLKQKRLHQSQSQKESIISIRDKLVKDMFKIMRGEIDVKA